MIYKLLVKFRVEKNATGVSALSWGSYAIVAAVWNREKPIIFIYSGYILVDIFIVVY